jgi:hypothetical protein
MKEALRDEGRAASQFCRLDGIEVNHRRLQHPVLSHGKNKALRYPHFALQLYQAARFCPDRPSARLLTLPCRCREISNRIEALPGDTEIELRPCFTDVNRRNYR